MKWFIMLNTVFLHQLKLIISMKKIELVTFPELG
jgi:hypothetical protein